MRLVLCSTFVFCRSLFAARNGRLRAGLLLAVAVFVFGRAAGASDLLLVHGHIYTANPDAKWAEAIAITGDRIDALGSDAEILKRKTASSKVVDLHGRTVLPGFTDAHVHIWFGSLALHGFNLATPERTISPNDRGEFTAAIKAYVSSHPNEKIYFGRAAIGYPGEKPLNHALLDSIVSDRPMVVHSTSEHSLFVNAKALELAGIGDKPLKDPDLEKRIDRDKAGHPTGMVREAAMELIEHSLPELPLAERLKLLHAGEQFLNSFGVTSIVAATGGLADLANYDALRKQGMLTLRIRQAFGAVAVNHHLTPQFLGDLEKARSTYHDDWLQANEVKFFMDGLATAPLYTNAEYQKIITELDRRNIHVMSHATTAEGSTIALDALKTLEATNGPKDRRFRIEHAYLLKASDIPRFGQLGMIASMQPAFCCFVLSAVMPGIPDSQKQSQWNSVEKAGGMVEFSSDWPCSWPPSPLMGIQTATERELMASLHVTKKPGDVPKYDDIGERLTVEQAVQAYTRTAAFVNFTDKKLGTLEAGKLADLVVISGDIFTMPHEQIGSTKVDATVVGGKVVYGRF